MRLVNRIHWSAVAIMMLAPSQPTWCDCGGAWTPGPAPVTTEPNNVHLFTAGNSSIYVAGNFTYPSAGDAAHNIARWTGGSPAPLRATTHPGGEGTNNSVHAVRIRQTGAFPVTTSVYVGGDFTMAGNSAANHIAVFTQTGSTTAWNQMGQGFNFSVNALEFYNNELYAGGNFTMSGTTACNRIARWTGSAWQPVGTFQGSGQVFELISFGGFLYAGGVFDVAGADCSLARWNGSSWTYFTQFAGLNSPVDNPLIRALAIHDGTLVIGGTFRWTNGPLTNDHLIAYDGTNWMQLGSPDDFVTALASHDGDLYMGGQFSNVDGFGSQNIARRSSATNTWEQVGAGIDDWVAVLQPIGGLLHVGGLFATPIGESAPASPGWWLWDTTCICPSDITGDTAVGVPDLLAVINSWGACPRECAADIAPPGGDGAVGVLDLLSLINNWGACP